MQFTQSILALGGKLVEMRSVELLASLTGMHPALHPIHVQNSIDCRREKLLNVAVAHFLISTRMPEQTFWLDRRCLACLISKYQKWICAFCHQPGAWRRHCPEALVLTLQLPMAPPSGWRSEMDLGPIASRSCHITMIATHPCRHSL